MKVDSERRSKAAPEPDAQQQTLANQMAAFAQPTKPRAFWPRQRGVGDLHNPYIAPRSKMAHT